MGAAVAVFCYVLCAQFFLAPLLVYCNKRWHYSVATLLLIVAFMVGQVFTVTHHGVMDEPFDEMVMGVPPRDMQPPQGDRPPRGDRPPKKMSPPRAFGGQDSVAFIIISLLLGLNMGAKYYFKTAADRKRLRDLERDNLNTQLQYLKYQINPHFFMNTLNNIHALVLIDPEQANEMIETLSRLMRYVLYDGNRTMAPLKKKLAFIQNFIDLMRVRYTEQVQVEVLLPTVVPDVLVPSLLFATFIENAFKHGVSYEASSYITVSVVADDDKICIECINSRFASTPTAAGGLGLANARKRLQLVYGHRYHLAITPTNTDYKVVLTLPTAFRKNNKERTE